MSAFFGTKFSRMKDDNTYTIALAKIEQLDELLTIFAICRLKMISEGLFQWDERYPDAAVVAEDIRKESVFTLSKDGVIVGTITLNEVQPAAYEAIQWKYPTGKVLVIHRLAIHPHAQGKAYAKKMCLFAENWAREKGYELIRLDAYSANVPANRLYKNLNYHLADGFCYFHGNELPFYCYEKLL